MMRVKMFHCDICGVVKSDMTLLKLHINHYHDDSDIYRCDICGVITGFRKVLVRHMRIHKNGYYYYCDRPKCPMRYVSLDKLNKHKQYRHSGQRQVCRVCNKSLLLYTNMARHMLRHTGERPHKCDICGTGCVFKPDLDAHKRRHAEKLTCDVCGRATWACKKNVRNHLLTHVEEKTVACSICQKLFAHEWLMAPHMKYVHRDATFGCPQCGKKFKTIWGLKIHVRSQHDSVKEGFDKHNKRQHKEQRQVCTVCNKSLLLSTNMAKHMLRHTGERPHKCDMCGIDFVATQDLFRHKRRHGKKLTCDICGRVHAAKNEIIYHIMTHVEQKTVACSICQKLFAHEKLMTAHVKRVHRRQATFVCPHCGKKFKRNTTLKSHINSHCRLVA